MTRLHSRRGRLIAAAAAVLAFAFAPQAVADPGGGGGGGSTMPSATGPRYDANEEYRAGVEAMQAGNYREAERRFQRVVRVVDDHAPAYVLLGEAQLQQGEYGNARRNFERALRLDAGHITARQQLAVAYALLGENDAALNELDTLRARVAECAGTCPEATALDQAVATLESFFFPDEETGEGAGGEETGSLTPEADLARYASVEAGDGAYLQAVSLINERRYEEALAAFREAEDVFGPHPDVLTYVGFTNRKLGRYDDAQRYYELALSIDPDHRGALEYYGELHVERGDLATARAYLERLDAVCAFGCPQADELRAWIESAEEAT